MGAGKKINELEKVLNYEFKDKELLKKALIHRSYGNENRKYKKIDNERLELLGDAVLDLIITEYIFKKYPNSSEGYLAKLKSMIVSEPVLADISLENNIGDYLFLSKGEEKTGGRKRKSILGDTFEALLGALYLDSEFETAREFVLKYFKERIEHIEENEELIDYKTILQEYSQQKYKQIPKYVILEEIGPDHNKQFKIGVEIKNELLATGMGKNKKSAEQRSAKNTCKKLEIKPYEAL